MKKHSTIFSLIYVLTIFITFSVSAQSDSSWNVLLLKKGHQLETKPDMAVVSNTGFYLYKNCVYEIDLKNKQHISGRLVDIKADTLVFTNYFNANVAHSEQSELDTLFVPYKELHQLNLISDRALALYTHYAFDKYDFIFKKDTINYYFPSEWCALYYDDIRKSEVVTHLTEQGITALYEENGKTHYFYGAGMSRPDRSAMDTTYTVKNVFWITPCKVEEINGFALSLYTENIKNDGYGERDSLVIRGVNLELNPFAIFYIMDPHLNGPYPDSINLYHEKLKKDWQVEVHGVNMSALTTIYEMRMKGFNLTGLSTVVDEIQGLSISGMNNFCYLLDGVSLAGLRNRATFAKGLQIGLFNKATDLRGFQFGLWNKNGKRSLPFINWQFKART